MKATHIRKMHNLQYGKASNQLRMLQSQEPSPERNTWQKGPQQTKEQKWMTVTNNQKRQTLQCAKG